MSPSLSNSSVSLAASIGMAAVALAVGTVVGSRCCSSNSSCSKAGSCQQRYPVEEMKKCTTEKEKFLVIYPHLRDEIVQHIQSQNLPEEAAEWCRQVMEYNVPGGKLNRGTTVMSVYKALKPNCSEEELAKAAVLGWAIEFLQAFFLVADDVMDDSQTRRGQPCWYKLPNVKMIAINDSFLLESFVFTILKKHFHGDVYHHLVDLMLDVVQKTEFGQLLDLTSQPVDGSKADLNRFTLERYQKIVQYKTAYYSFYLSVAMGMILAGMSPSKDAAAFESAQTICLLMGEYFQIQDDYLDCFGDPKVIGKVGTDIQDNKCSWLVVQALKRCAPEQRKVLQDNYGEWDDAKVKAVKELYTAMGLPAVFATYEEDSYQAIQEELKKVTIVPREVFELFLKKIYKRTM